MSHFHVGDQVFELDLLDVLDNLVRAHRVSASRSLQITVLAFFSLAEFHQLGRPACGFPPALSRLSSTESRVSL